MVRVFSHQDSHVANNLSQKKYMLGLTLKQVDEIISVSFSLNGKFNVV